MLIASCTSYPLRVGNLPKVVDTILNQTCPPDKVIINLSKDEFPNYGLPNEVQAYIDSQDKVSVNWLEGNWKVYKKFLPILKDYPDALICPFDDDILYPNTMFEEFMEMHKQFPNSPITGADVKFQGLNQHCGCASMVQAKHFEGWEKYVTPSFINTVLSSDSFYSQLAALNGYMYRPTKTDYYGIHKELAYNEVNPYSKGPKVKKSLRLLAEILGKSVYKHFSDDEKKPLCVLGAANCLRGKMITEEMLKWLKPNFNVFVLEHDGSTFEYAALKFLQNLIKTGTYKGPVFYLHTKGAYHVRRESEATRRMWKYEFVDRQRLYLETVGTDKAVLATPYSGIISEKNRRFAEENMVYPTYFPYENGWCANEAAVLRMKVIPSTNRYWFEMCMYDKTEVVGLRKHLINLKDIKSRLEVTEDILTF